MDEEPPEEMQQSIENSVTPRNRWELRELTAGEAEDFLPLGEQQQVNSQVYPLEQRITHTSLSHYASQLRYQYSLAREDVVGYVIIDPLERLVQYYQRRIRKE
ncbi:MAG: hypothetical protein Q8R53_05415 [Nanoarchaeota archaeon]|nr:hypothetical protein [Nanoarchaeota archaeon]